MLQLYDLLFGTDIETHNQRVARYRRSLRIPDLSHTGFNSRDTAIMHNILGVETLPNNPSEYMPHLHRSLMYQILIDNPRLLMDPEVMDVVGKLMGFKAGAASLEPHEVADVIRVSWAQGGGSII